MASLLTQAQIKQLAKELRDAMQQPAPAKKGANGVSVNVEGSRMEFRHRPTQEHQERGIG